MSNKNHLKTNKIDIKLPGAKSGTNLDENICWWNSSKSRIWATPDTLTYQVFCPSNSVIYFSVRIIDRVLASQRTSANKILEELWPGFGQTSWVFGKRLTVGRILSLGLSFLSFITNVKLSESKTQNHLIWS